jgi:hypothetical protein
MQAFTHLSGARRSIEHAVIGRRACEVEWDLLELLGPRSGAHGAFAGPPRAATGDPAHDRPVLREVQPPLHDRPTAIELLDAARSALGEHVLVELSGRPAFELRVTLRALGIVRRELELTSEHAALHAAALSRLGVASEHELAEAIRRGAFDGRDGTLRPELREITRAKLEAANPAYLQTYETTSEGEET